MTRAVWFMVWEFLLEHLDAPKIHFEIKTLMSGATVLVEFSEIDNFLTGMGGHLPELKIVIAN